MYINDIDEVYLFSTAAKHKQKLFFVENGGKRGKKCGKEIVGESKRKLVL